MQVNLIKVLFSPGEV
uniref:Uncharacterized protein n=1 Tax=Arundo donax TaxID=35708 RepID=A0A0A8ZB79_ARUDO